MKFRGVHKAKEGTNLTRIKKVSGPGGFPEKPPGRARRRETPQPPDRMNKDWTKTANQRRPSGILNNKSPCALFIGVRYTVG